MQRPTLSIVLYLCLVFISGALVGGFGVSLYSKGQGPGRPPSPEERARHYLDDMKSRLKLNDEQVVKLKAIMEATRTRFDAMREKNRPEVQEIQQHHSESVRAILNDAQRAEYAKMQEEREKRRGAPGRRP